MKIGIDGRAAKWYRGTGIGTYTYQLISSLNNVDSSNNYLIFTPQCDFITDLKNNFKTELIESIPSNSFWDDINVPNILNNADIELYHVHKTGLVYQKMLNAKKLLLYMI